MACHSRTSFLVALLPIFVLVAMMSLQSSLPPAVTAEKSDPLYLAPALPVTDQIHLGQLSRALLRVHHYDRMPSLTLDQRIDRACQIKAYALIVRETTPAAFTASHLPPEID